MAYGYQTRIAYSEIDSDRKLTLPGIINLFQDVATFHGEDCGVSNKWLTENRLGWVLSSWQILVREMPELSTRVLIETYPYQYRYCIAYRYFSIKSLEGEEYIRGHSIWVLMNMEKYAPVRISKDIAEKYGPVEDVYKGTDFGARRIEKRGEFTSFEEIRTGLHMIDTNHHVNNEQYVNITQNYLPEGFSWNSFRGEYTKQARLGDILIPQLHKEDGLCQVALVNPENEQYFIGEWSRKDVAF